MGLTARIGHFFANTLAAKHRRAARTHEQAAEKHMATAAHWGTSGVPERAVHEVRHAMLERQLARLERDRARLEEVISQRAVAA